MFGNRSLQVSVVKTPKPGTAAPDETPEKEGIDVDKVSNLVITHTNHLAKLAGTAYVAKRVVDAACEIAVIIAKAKIK